MRFGDAEWQEARGVEVDALDNVLLAGSFWGTVGFGGPQLSSAGNLDVFLVKLAPNGSHLWSKRFGDADVQWAYSLAVAADGSPVVAGQFGGTVNFGGGPLTSAGGWDLYLARFSANGSHVWSERFGNPETQWGNSVAVDADGNVLLAGEFAGTVDFGGGPLVAANLMDAFAAKFDAAGVHVWSAGEGSALFQTSLATAADGDGNVFVAGNFHNTVDFGGGPLASAGDEDIFLVKFGPSGQYHGGSRFGDAARQRVHALAVDSNGNVLMTGSFEGSVDFGGGPLDCGGGRVAYLAKLGPDGGHIWSKQFGPWGDQRARDVAVAADGNVVLTGYFSLDIDFDGLVLTSTGQDDAFVAKLDAAGSVLWAKHFGDDSIQLGRAVAVDSKGYVIATGEFDGTADFGCGPLVSAGDPDVFVVKLSP